MATEKKINYYARNFSDVRTELIEFIKRYYPEIFSDFNDASVGMMLVELNAAVSDMLSYHTDRMFNETQLDYAQERKNIFAIARTLGLKIPGLRPSVSLVDYVVTVPPFGDTWDQRYAPVIRYGSQVVGGGQSFENLEDIDFSSPFTTGGVPNRLILPNLDQNGTLVNYDIVKRELVVNGSSKIFKKVITSSDAVPFLEIVLPDTNILSIESIVTLEGTDFVRTPTLDEFLEFDNRWYEMDSLAEDKVFIEDPTRVADNLAVKPGKWVETTRKFVKEFTDNGFCKLTFGSGDPEQDRLNSLNTTGLLKIGDFINTTSLGEIPRVGTTMFIRYRVGGGSSSNVGPNIISNIGNATVDVTGPTEAINTQVRRSLRVNNPIPALGGAGVPSTEQVRQMTKYNFASQNRAVTIKDYAAQIFKMPGTFGVPFRCGVTEDQNKIQIYVLGLDSNGLLTNSSTNTLKENIATWLADYRMINDYVLVRDGRIINLAFDIDLFIDKNFNQSEIINATIQKVRNYFDIKKWEMGDTIYLSQLVEEINNVGGVLNVTDLRVYNKFADEYSINQTTQTIAENVDSQTNRIDLSEDYALFGELDTMFEIKYPNKDIKVRIKRAGVL